MKAMILAAGRGERLRPLTDALPKPLLEVRGKPLIVHHLERLCAAGFHDVIVNVAWQADKIRNYLADGARYGLRIRYSPETDGALDTGGGIFYALPLLGKEPFLVVNADLYTDFPFATLRAALPAGDWAHLVLVHNPPEHPQGDFHLKAGGRLELAGGERLTYAGIAVLAPELFSDCRPGRFPLRPLLEKAMAAGRAGGRLYRGLWADVGTRERLAALTGR